MEEELLDYEAKPDDTGIEIAVQPGIVVPGDTGPLPIVGDAVQELTRIDAKSTTDAVVKSAAETVNDIRSIVAGRQSTISDQVKSVRMDAGSAASMAVDVVRVAFDKIRSQVIKKCGDRLVELSGDVIQVINEISATDPRPAGLQLCQGHVLFPPGNGPGKVAIMPGCGDPQQIGWSLPTFPDFYDGVFCSADLVCTNWNGFDDLMTQANRLKADPANCSTNSSQPTHRYGPSPYWYGLPAGMAIHEIRQTDGGLWGWFVGDPREVEYGTQHGVVVANICPTPPPDPCTGPACPPLPGPVPNPFPPPGNPPPDVPPPECTPCVEPIDFVPACGVWNTVLHDVCDPEHVQQFVDGISDLEQSPTVGEFFSFLNGKAPDSLKPYLSNDLGSNLFSRIFGSIVSFTSNVIKLSSSTFGRVSGCDTLGFNSAASGYSLLGFMSKYLGSVPPVVIAKAEYALNANCQYVIPAQPELNMMCLREDVSTHQWEAATKMGGYCVDWQEKMRDIQSTKIDPLQTVMMWRRNELTDEEFDTYIKKLGVSSSKQKDMFKKLTLQYPGMSDLVRMMVRDVADRDVVRDENLDHDFDKKWIDKLKDWGKFQGVDDEIAQMYWRAHWQYPSNTQLYEMVHRLRPDRPKIGGKFDDQDVTLDDAQKLLEINDTAPKWVKRLLAISYRPFNKRDIKSLHCEQVIDGDGVENAFRELGYDADKAKALCQLIVSQNSKGSCAQSSGLTEKEILAYYRKDMITRDDAYDQLDDLQIDSEDINNKLRVQDFKRDADRRGKLIEALRRRFMIGDIDGDTVQSELSLFGLSEEQSHKVANYWRQSLRYKRKEGTASLLCDWWQRGLISTDAFQTRLINMGWFSDDVRRIIETCFLKLTEKNQQSAKDKVAALIAEDERLATLKQAKKDRIAKARQSNPITNGTYAKRFGESDGGSIGDGSDR